MIQFCLLSWFTLFSFASDDPKEILQPFLDKLGQPEEQVRIAVAENAKTPSELLELLSREGIDY